MLAYKHTVKQTNKIYLDHRKCIL